ncbi:hypothetical protein [Nitrosopumilus sp.]|uniref:hypothetical protein n=1 Tax=Nitrosopumilus sp. TaxID=2024843 RepID=UPI0034A021AA
MSTEPIPYIKWGDYTSHDENNPDVLEIKVSDLVTFDTEYSVNVQVLLKTVNGLEYRILPLKSNTSLNASLFNQWSKGVREKKIKKDTRFKLFTWIGESKNGFPIRRFRTNL